MALNVPMQTVQQPIVQSLSDAVAKWTDINNAQQQGQLATQKMDMLKSQTERENKVGDLKFATDKQSALKSVMTDVKSKMDDFTQKTGFSEGSPQFQQRLNAVYATTADPIVQNITGTPYKQGTNVEWQHVNSLAGMTPKEEQANKVAAIEAEWKARLPYQRELATIEDNQFKAHAGIGQTNALALEGARHNNDVADAKQKHQWDIDTKMEIGGSKLSDGELVNNALDLINGGTMPRNIGRENTVAIANTRDKILSGEINPDDVRRNAGAQKYENKSQAASLKTQVAQENAIKNMERLFDFNRGKLSDLAKSLNNDTSPVIQQWLQTGVKASNMSPEDANKLAAFDVYKNEVDNEYAKITSGSASGAGVIAQSEREHVRKLIQSANTLGQMQAALDAMGQSSRARMETLQKTKAETMAKLGANGGTKQAQPAQPPAGTKPYKMPDGRIVYVRVK